MRVPRSAVLLILLVPVYAFGMWTSITAALQNRRWSDSVVADQRYGRFVTHLRHADSADFVSDHSPNDALLLYLKAQYALSPTVLTKQAHDTEHPIVIPVRCYVICDFRDRSSLRNFLESADLTVLVRVTDTLVLAIKN